ncbi:hypothetical protein THIOM_001605 [Candidatus Thiomargarita nelsonii]|uniref:Uncharacterized protein n=1 Tax=Candidatus Thiomargarita nelsonii TaxID=1003181 RepID=A0A176S399_9GAMM|nr:hypothetical protein THIOM_001605 [Candidatus Thiomargarita nelsonii]
MGLGEAKDGAAGTALFPAIGARFNVHTQPAAVPAKISLRYGPPVDNIAINSVDTALVMNVIQKPCTTPVDLGTGITTGPKVTSKTFKGGDPFDCLAIGRIGRS